MCPPEWNGVFVYGGDVFCLLGVNIVPLGMGEYTIHFHGIIVTYKGGCGWLLVNMR